MAHQLDIHIETLIIAFFSSVSALFFSFLVFRLVLLCRPSIGPSTGNILGLIVSVNSNLIPSGLGLRPERLFVLVSFFFLFFLLFPFCFFPLCPSFFSGVRMYHGYVPDIIALQVIRDGIRQFVGIVPLRAATAMQVLFFFLALRRFFVASLTTG